MCTQSDVLQWMAFKVDIQHLHFFSSGEIFEQHYHLIYEKVQLFCSGFILLDTAQKEKHIFRQKVHVKCGILSITRLLLLVKVVVVVAAAL